MNDHDNLNEYQALVKRNFGPYSSGHRLMYDIPISMLKNSDCQNKYSILDVGVGIGYGLEQMLRAGIVGVYVGFEPDECTYKYVAPRSELRYDYTADVRIINKQYPQITREYAPLGFDFSFCIEVLEHIPLVEMSEFLSSLCTNTVHTLFLSTPNVAKNSHGVLSPSETRSLLNEAGFDQVTIMDKQWTDLYICQKYMEKADRPYGDE